MHAVGLTTPCHLFHLTLSLNFSLPLPLLHLKITYLLFQSFIVKLTFLIHFKFTLEQSPTALSVVKSHLKPLHQATQFLFHSLNGRCNRTLVDHNPLKFQFSSNYVYRL